MLAAVAAVLLIVCCANLGGLLSAQSAAREGEFAVRLSLGAGPLRIMRQLVTESLLLAVAGGAGGLLVSRVFIGTLARQFFSMDDEGHPLYYDFSQSSGIAAATMMTAVGAGVLFSILPAIRAVRRPSLRTAQGRSDVRAVVDGTVVAGRAGSHRRCPAGHRGAPRRRRTSGARRAQLRHIARCADARAAAPDQVHAGPSPALSTRRDPAAARVAVGRIRINGGYRIDSRRRVGNCRAGRDGPRVSSHGPIQRDWSCIFRDPSNAAPPRAGVRRPRHRAVAGSGHRQRHVGEAILARRPRNRLDDSGRRHCASGRRCGRRRVDAEPERSRRDMGLYAVLAEPRRDRFEDCRSDGSRSGNAPSRIESHSAPRRSKRADC